MIDWQRPLRSNAVLFAKLVDRSTVNVDVSLFGQRQAATPMENAVRAFSQLTDDEIRAITASEIADREKRKAALVAGGAIVDSDSELA